MTAEEIPLLMTASRSSSPRLVTTVWRRVWIWQWWSSTSIYRMEEQRKLEPFPFRVNGEGSQALRQMLQAPVQGACHILLPEGLYQVVGGPCLKAFHAVIHAGGGIDNGHIASRGPEPLGRLNPGQTGHKDIEK